MNFLSTSRIALLRATAETLSQGGPMPVADTGESAEGVKEFLDEVGGDKSPATPAQEPLTNNPPIQTGYRPSAQNLDDLAREFEDVKVALETYSQTGNTTMTYKLAKACADLVYLGTPELKANLPEAGEIGDHFEQIKKNKELYKGLLKAAQRYIGPDLANDDTVKTLLNGAVKKACLLAYGYANMSLFRITGKGRIGPTTTGIDPEDMKQFDPQEFAFAISVPFNIFCPIIYRTVPVPGEANRIMTVQGSGKVNEDKTPYFLSTKTANLLYAKLLEGVPENSFDYDETGFIKGRKGTPQVQGGQTETRETATSDETTGEVATETRQPAGMAVSGEPRSFATMKAYVRGLKLLEGGESPVMGFISGMIECAKDRKHSISPVVLATLCTLTELIVERARETYTGKDDMRLAYGTAKKLAELKDCLDMAIKWDDGDVILWASDDQDINKNPQRLTPKTLPSNGKHATGEAQASA